MTELALTQCADAARLRRRMHNAPARNGALMLAVVSSLTTATLIMVAALAGSL